MTGSIIKKLPCDLSSNAGLALVGQYLKRINLNALVDSAFPLRSGISNSDIVRTYLALLCMGKKHGTHEQFHSGLKTDMGLERLPSGKFDTKHLVCQMACVGVVTNQGLFHVNKKGNGTPDSTASARHRHTAISASKTARDAPIKSNPRNAFHDFILCAAQQFVQCNCVKSHSRPKKPLIFPPSGLARDVPLKARPLAISQLISVLPYKKTAHSQQLLDRETR